MLSMPTKLRDAIFGGQSLTYELNGCCLILVHGLMVNVDDEVGH